MAGYGSLGQGLPCGAVTDARRDGAGPLRSRECEDHGVSSVCSEEDAFLFGGEGHVCAGEKHAVRPGGRHACGTAGPGREGRQHARGWERPMPPPPAGRLSRVKLLASSVAFFLSLCGVLLVHKPVDGTRRRRANAAPRLLSGHDRHPMRATMNLETQSIERPMVRAYNGDYGSIKQPTLRLYGIDLLLEPHRETTLEVTAAGERSTFEWKVGVYERGSGKLKMVREGPTEQPYFNLTCTTPGDRMQVKVVETSANGTQRTYETDKAACKYVRREIRSLTEHDREAYLNGVEEVHRLNISEARAKYGAKFRNYEVFTAMHNSKTFCYHGGDQFITAHAAFTHLLDLTLQLQDPTVVSPYWDFMLDSAELGTEWYRSIIYSDDWFGSVDNTADSNFMISRGRFAHIPMAYDPDKKFEAEYDFGPDYNIQGYVASHRNLNAAGYVQRSRQMCGMSEKQEIAKCDAFTACFDDYSTLEDWAMCMEVNVHANMHEWHGGAWHCSYDLKNVSDTYPQYSTDLLLFLGTVAHDVWFIYTNETISHHGICPTTCSDDAPDAQSGCECLCELDLDSMDDETVLTVMHPTLYTLQFIFYEGRDYLRYDEDLKTFRFSNGDVSVLSYEDHVRLVRIVGSLMCNTGLAGPMGSGAAPNDPIFWPMHPIFDRAWHLLLLSPKYSETYDITWTDGNCYGSRWNDTQVFTDLTSSDSGKVYTNADLWEFFAATNPHLTYIYDDFKIWGDCSDWNGDEDI